MKFKLLGTAILSSALVLTACGQSEDPSKKDDDKNLKENLIRSLMIQRKIKTSQKIKKNLLMKRVKIAKNSHKNSKLTQEQQQTQQQNNQNNQQEGVPQQNYQSQDSQSSQQTQQPVNSAREQALKEGIDFDNPTDEEIERMRELSKIHHTDCKNLLKQDLMNNSQGSLTTLLYYTHYDYYSITFEPLRVYKLHHID